MSCHAMQLLPVPVACSTAAFPFCSNAAATFAYASALTLFKLIGIVFSTSRIDLLAKNFSYKSIMAKSTFLSSIPGKKEDFG